MSPSTHTLTYIIWICYRDTNLPKGPKGRGQLYEYSMFSAQIHQTQLSTVGVQYNTHNTIVLGLGAGGGGLRRSTVMKATSGMRRGQSKQAKPVCTKSTYIWAFSWGGGG